MPEPPLRIPDRFLDGFSTLRDLSAEEAASLASAFEAPHDAPEGAPTLAALRSLAQAALPDRSADAVNDLVLAVLGLSYQSRSTGTASDSLAANVSTSPRLVDPEDLGAADRLRQRLAGLLAAPTVILSGATAELAAENDATFVSARTIVDVRPVFGPEPNDSPLGALLVTNLKIDFFDAQGDLQSFFVTLGLSELKELGEVLARADQKVAALESLMAEASIRHLAPTGD